MEFEALFVTSAALVAVGMLLNQWGPVRKCLTICVDYKLKETEISSLPYTVCEWRVKVLSTYCNIGSSEADLYLESTLPSYSPNK